MLERFSPCFALDDRPLHSQLWFWVAAFLPASIGLIALFAMTWQLPFCFQTSCFETFFRLSKGPFALAAAGIPLATLVAKLHQSIVEASRADEERLHGPRRQRFIDIVESFSSASGLHYNAPKLYARILKARSCLMETDREHLDPVGVILVSELSRFADVMEIIIANSNPVQPSTADWAERLILGTAQNRLQDSSMGVYIDDKPFDWEGLRSIWLAVCEGLGIGPSSLISDIYNVLHYYKNGELQRALEPLGAIKKFCDQVNSSIESASR